MLHLKKETRVQSLSDDLLIIYFVGYLDLVRTGLKRMNTGYLLEAIQTDDDKAVVQFGCSGFLNVDFVQKETIE